MPSLESYSPSSSMSDIDSDESDESGSSLLSSMWGRFAGEGSLRVETAERRLGVSSSSRLTCGVIFLLCFLREYELRRLIVIIGSSESGQI